MTMLTHRARPVRAGSLLLGKARRPVRSGAAKRTWRRSSGFLLGVVTILAAGAAVAAIMALKIAIYLPRFIHH